MGRIPAIDCGRVFAILGVLTLHSRLFRGQATLEGWEKYTEIILDHLSRFAVPYFFFVSGYLFERSRGDQPPLDRALSQAKRIMLIYLLWSGVLWSVDIIESAIRRPPVAINLAEIPNKLLYGVRMHLWFLPALVQCMLLSAICGASMRGGIIAVGLYFIGLAGGSYVSLTQFDLGVWSRNSVFFGTVFIWAGRRAALNPPPTRWAAGGLILLGGTLHLLEMLYLHHVAGQAWLHERINFLGGTLLLGIGVGWLAISWPNFGQHTPLPRLGIYTLGIYILHLDVMQWLAEWYTVDHIPSQLVFIVITFAITLAVVYALTQIRSLRKWLM